MWKDAHVHTPQLTGQRGTGGRKTKNCRKHLALTHAMYKQETHQGSLVAYDTDVPTHATESWSQYSKDPYPQALAFTAQPSKACIVGF